jgi:hypothetical protein
MLYRVFSSLRTSVYILAFMCVIFLAGTIFPQGEELDRYIDAGGKFIFLVKTLDLLDVFVSPLFLVTTAILLLNLIICLYDRFRIFIRLRRRALSVERLKEHLNVIRFKKDDVEERLKEIGFKLKSDAGDDVRIYEKGLQYWWLSWFYHVGIITAILGFFLTALFAFEESVILYPGEPETVSLYSENTRWNQFMKALGMEPSGGRDDEYTFLLKEFRTEYYQGLKIDYPKDILGKLSLSLNMKKLKPSEEGFSYMPKMWLTRLDVTKPDGTVLDAELRVNRPFRTGGLTLYQMGYEQWITLKAGDEVIEVEARVPFEVKGIEGKFVLGSLKLGSLYKRDGTVEDITPVSTLYHMPGGDSSSKDEIGELELGGMLEAGGVTFEFKGYKEGSYLSYRKDPGAWFVGLACLFVFAGLFIRSFGAWYRVQYAIVEDVAYVLISTRGILADKDRMIRRLKK